MLFSQKVQFSGPKPFFPSKKCYVYLINPKQVEIIHVDEEFSIISQKEFYFQNQVHEIIPHPSQNKFMIFSSKQNSISLINDKSEPEYKVIVENKIERVLFTPAGGNIMIVEIGENLITVQSQQRDDQWKITKPKFNEGIKNPQYLFFSPSGKFLAVKHTLLNETVLRHKVIIYSTRSWEIVETYSFNRYESFGGLKWISTTQFVVWQNHLTHNITKINIFGSPEGVCNYSAGTKQLGISKVEVLENRLLLLEDHGFRIIQKSDFKVLKVFNFSDLKKRDFVSTVFYREIEKESKWSYQIQILTFELLKELFSLKSNTPHSKESKDSKDSKSCFNVKKVQKQLINKTISCKISAYPHSYIAFYVHCFSNVLLIWSNMTMRFQSVVIMKEKISEFQWSPENNILMYLSKNDRLNFWSPCGVSSYPMKTPLEEGDQTQWMKNLMLKKSAKTFKTTITWKDPLYLNIVNKSVNNQEQSYFRVVRLSESFIDLIEYGTLEIDKDFKCKEIESQKDENLSNFSSKYRGFAASTVSDEKTRSTEDDDDF